MWWLPCSGQNLGHIFTHAKAFMQLTLNLPPSIFFPSFGKIWCSGWSCLLIICNYNFAGFNSCKKAVSANSVLGASPCRSQQAHQFMSMQWWPSFIFYLAVGYESIKSIYISQVLKCAVRVAFWPNLKGSQCARRSSLIPRQPAHRNRDLLLLHQSRHQTSAFTNHQRGDKKTECGNNQ